MMVRSTASESLVFYPTTQYMTLGNDSAFLSLSFVLSKVGMSNSCLLHAWGFSPLPRVNVTRCVLPRLLYSVVTTPSGVGQSQQNGGSCLETFEKGSKARDWMRWPGERVRVGQGDVEKGKWAPKGAISLLLPACPGPFRKGEEGICI